MSVIDFCLSVPSYLSRMHGDEMDEEVLAYLRDQRSRIRARIGVLRSGRCWTSETLDGQQMDTTAQTLEMLEDNLEEIDRLLTRAGVPLES